MSDPAQDVVRVVRTGALEPLTGRIHLSTAACIVMSELSDSLDLDGICIIPTRTVRYLDRDLANAEFYRAALTAWPNLDAHASLLGELSCDMVTDLRHLESAGRTISVYMELDDPDICFVGTVRQVTAAALLLDRISSRGERINEPMRIELDAITRVETGSRYLIAVAQAARVLSRSEAQSD